MNVVVKEVKKDYCNCNYCKRGVLNSYQTGLDYPYKKVFEFGGDSNSYRSAICEDCLNELIKLSNNLKPL